MKYTKIIAIILLVCIFISAIYGCKPQDTATEYPAYTVFIADTDAAKDVWPDIDPISDQSETAPQTMTVEINGVSYTGDFKYTFALPTASYIPGLYYTGTDSTGYYINFIVDEQTFELRDFSRSNPKNPEIPCSITPEEGRKIADSIADDYIDLSKYCVEESVDPDENACEYRYYKEINGYEVIDDVWVKLYGDGSLDHIRVRMPGSFDKVKDIKLDKVKLEAVLDQKMNEVGPTYVRGNSKWVGYEIYHSFLIQVKNGQYAVKYGVSVKFEEDLGDGKVAHDGQYLDVLVIVDHEE